jgi:hypothetical protein
VSENETFKSPDMNIIENRALRVVAHYRRGDVDVASGHLREKMTNPSWYFNIMGAIKRIYPDASLRAFTSCSPTKMSWSQCEQLNLTDVPIWRKHGIELHVDNEGNLGSTWFDQATTEWNIAFRIFSNADVFITARSPFSQAATYFNANCVIRNSVLHYIKHLPLKRWIEIVDPDTTGQDRSYVTDHNMIAGLYKSYYNDTYLSITGQDPSMHFTGQLRSALKSCLPSKHASLLENEPPQLMSGGLVPPSKLPQF